jgi:hypothetical protein
MHRTRIVGAVIVIALGLVWIGQGSGFLRGSSFMVGDPRWIAIGLVAAIVGLGVVIVDLRRAG